MNRKPPPSPKTIVRRHEHMVSDPQRTPYLERAIRQTVKPGDTVMDLGCGLGVLTEIALKAGATKVHACEVDDSIHLAKKRIRELGLAERVKFFHGLSSEMESKGKVDVIIAETVGSLAFNESILPFVIDARERFLKKGGAVIPKALSLHVAPLGALPSEIKNPKARVRGKVTDVPFHIATVSPKDLLAPATEYARADLTEADEIGFDLEVRFSAERDGSLVGFAGWMEITWAPGVITKTSPDDAPTHWKQAVLPNGEKIAVKKGDEILFRLRIVPKEDEFATESLIEWGYRVTPGRKTNPRPAR